jgi:hypothetical protein
LDWLAEECGLDTAAPPAPAPSMLPGKAGEPLLELGSGFLNRTPLKKLKVTSSQAAHEQTTGAGKGVEKQLNPL